MANPLLSVVMPVYNPGHYLAEAVQSILSQSFGDFEFIIVDDGSTDGSPKLLADFAARDGRVRVIRQENRGIVAALNRGIAEARGTFIARMDADDISMPDRFAKQVAYLRQHEDCVVVGGRVMAIDADGEEICEYFTYSGGHEGMDADHLRHGSRLAHPTVMMRAEAIRRVGGYRPQFELIEDLDLWLRLAEVGRMHNLPDVLLRYRIRVGTLSSSKLSKRARVMNLVRADAYRRRGIAEPPPLGPEDVAEQSEGEMLGNLARAALSSGKYGNARRLARQALRTAPRSTRNWMTWGLAFTGPVGQWLLARWYGARADSLAGG